MPRTAETIFVGDAASLIRAAEEAKLAVAGAETSITGSGSKIGSSFMSMSGAGKKAASELEQSGGRMGSVLAGIASSGNLAVAGIAAVGVAVVGIKRSADTFEEIGKTILKVHELTGLSVKSASQYAAVAKVNDINVKGLMMSFVTLSKNVQAVTNAQDGLTKGAHTQENAFKLLGLPLRDVVGAHGNLNKLLPEVVSKFEHLSGSTSKAAIAQALFGRGAKELVPLMHTGALGLKEQLEEAEKYGAAVGKMSSNEFKKFIKAQEEAKYALLGLEMTIGQKVAPALSSLISGFAGVVKSIRDGSGTIGKAAHVIGVVFSAMWKETEFAWKIQDQVIGAFVSAVASAASAVGKAVGTIIDGFKGLASGVSHAVHAAVDAVRGFFNSFYDVGKYLVEGLKKGVEAGAEAIVHAVASPIEGAISVGESILEAKSPSKVFHRIGLSVSEGFAEGIHAGKPLAHDAARALAASATGGFTAASGTNYSKGVEPTLARDLDRLGKALGVKLTGISGYRTPQHSVEVGGFANDPHTRGEASDTEGVQRIAEATLERFGLTRPLPGAKEANHIQLLKGAAHGASGGSVASQIVSFFVSHGLSPAQAAGIAGNAMQESGDNPSAPGGGLFQYIGSRAASGTGSLGHQLGATWKELSGAYRGALAALRHAKTPGAAAKLFSDLFERPGIPMLANREKYAREALAGFGGVVTGAGGVAAPKAEPGLTLNPRDAAAVLGLSSGGNRAHAQGEQWGAIASQLGEGWQSHRALQVARNKTGAAGMLGIDRQDAKVAMKQREIYGAELGAVKAEAKKWGALRDRYRKIARHQHGKAKKEALDKAAEYAGKVATAEQDAKAIGGNITAAETAIAEAGNAIARVPGEVGAEDLSSYQAANAKVDAEVRAGILSEAQGKAAKEANAGKALGGGYGTLSEEGMLQVKGDLREFQAAVEGSTDALKAHTEALESSAKALKEFAAIASSIGAVEASSMAKSLADTVSGQIAGVDYAGQKMTAGTGRAARY